MDKEKIILPNSLIFGEATEILLAGSDVTLPTKGNSMLPFIRGDKDTITLRRLDKIDKDHIVLALIGGKHILHRVWSVEGDNYILMGDGNLRGKEYCHRKDIIATVVCINRASGKKIDTLSNKHLRYARIWRRLLPLRRIILGIYKRLP